MHKATSHFHAGSNDPGYLPDDLPATFSAWEDAQRFVIGELLSDADSVATWNDEHDCDDVPCPTYSDECPEGKASDLTNVAEELNLDNGPDWSTITAGRSYWIHSCGCAPGQAELAEESDDEQPDLVALEAEAKARSTWPKTPSMTRQHFDYLARILVAARGEGLADVDRLVGLFAYHLADTNSHFDSDRFIEAATKR